MNLKRKEFIFQEPTPTPSCHASTIVKTDGGRLIAAWFAGTKEKANDVVIYTSFCEKGTWSRPQAVTPDDGFPHWNPVLLKTGAGTVYLFYKRGYEIADWQTFVIMTEDGGESWSAPRELVPGDVSGGRGPVKNKAVRISDGRILAPASVERGPWRPFIDISREEDILQNGWRRMDIPVEGPDAEKTHLIQPSLWEYPEGQLHVLLRSNRGKIYRSDSVDMGETWSAAYATDMPNNNSGLDCTMLEDGRLVLVCNPVGGDRAKRTPLSVFTSSDNGASFQKELDLETEDGEFSYPAIIRDGDSMYVTYTWNRKKIVFCEIAVPA